MTKSSPEIQPSKPIARRIFTAGVIWPVVFTISAIFFWLLLINTSLKSGFSWTLIKSRLDGHIAYTLQDQLFAVDRQNIDIKTIIIGDRLFIEAARQELDKDASVAFLELPGFTLADVREAMLSAKALEADVVVMQNSPYMWTNFWFRRAAPNLKLWDQKGQNAKLFDKKRANLVFDMLEQAVKGTGNAALEKFNKRPDNMFSVRWSDTPRGARGWDRYVKRTSPGGPASVIWVTDNRELAENIDPTILTEFNERFPAGFKEDFGWVVSEFDDIKVAIRKAKQRQSSE